MNTISLLDGLFPASSPADMESFYKLLAIIADPAGTKKRLDELAAGQAEAQKTVDAANLALADLDATRLAQERALKTERDEHESALEQSKSQFGAYCTRRIQELDARDDAATQLFAKATADSAAAAELRADLERRVAAIKAAVQS
jgi:hypothetical protein